MGDWLDADTVRALGQGLIITVGLTIITSALALVIGIGTGTLRLHPRRVVSGTAGAFVEVFRNVPALIQIIFWAFAFPSFFPAGLRRTIFFNNALWDWLADLTRIPLPYYGVAACVGLVLNTGAHLAEIFRSGVGTLSNDLVDSARSLGAGRWAVFRTLLLPGGVRASFPAITTRLVHNMKNTALASFVAVPELFHEMQASINQSFRASELLLLAAGMYLVLGWMMSTGLRHVSAQLHRGRHLVGGRHV